jgi:hypothetical protein
MHLIVAYAGTASEPGHHTLQSLPLPRLERLLARLTPVGTLGSDESSLSPPHELAMAEALGWPLRDGTLPWAARRAAELGLDDAGGAWALLTPVHLEAGADQVTLIDPAELALDEAESRELLEAVRPLFESEGFRLHWDMPTQWLARHDSFRDLATASLDRVAGRNIDPWLPAQPTARLLRRLQNEVQMLLHNQPLNERRESAGLPTVNSFWFSGCGSLPAGATAAAAAPVVDDRLRAPALAEDWTGWREAWMAMDAGPISALHDAAGSAASPLRLTLCGERQAQRFEARPQAWSQRLLSRWRRPSLLAVLESL